MSELKLRPPKQKRRLEAAYEMGAALAPFWVLCYSVFAFVALVSPFVFKAPQVQPAAFLFPTRLTAVSPESAKDARFPSKVAPERVHQIAFI